MSVPEGTRPRWPLRSAGFALLGLAAAAALTGVVLLVSDDGTAVGGRRPGTSEQAPGSASASPSTPLSPAPTAPSARPSSPAPAAPSAPGRPTPSVPTPGVPVPGGSAPAGPPPSGPGKATPAPGFDSDVAASGKGEARGAARVYNNSTIHGLAARAANDLTAAGWTVVEVGNYSGGRIWTTTVYYQEGTDQRATAEAIGEQFGMRVEPRFAGIAGARPGIIVIVTNDYGSR